MTKPITMTPQASRLHLAAQVPPSKKPAARPAAHPHPHPHPHAAPPARRGGHGGAVTIAVIALMAAGAGLWWLLGGPPAVDPGAQLQAQMEAAAQGVVAPTHAFGGPLTVTQANGRTNVVAEGVPSRACVQVGWRLAKEGTIVVNGTLPQRLSAARLSDLCSGDGATLLWIPEQ